MAFVCNLKDRAHHGLMVLYNYPIDLTTKLLTAAQEINGTSQKKETEEF